jgi:hypothetical protein
VERYRWGTVVLQPLQHSPLPKHHGWNEDPVGKWAKAAKIADAKAAKVAKASSKRQKEIDAKAAKEKLAAMEVNESFAQKEEIQQCICRQSEVENARTSSDDKDFELPDSADTGVSDNDAEGSTDASDDDQGLSQ